LAGKPAGDPIRICSLGCASGEEVYTVAIVLLETLGQRVFQRRVKIYGSDIDEETLGQARRGIYPLMALQGLSTERQRTYFGLRGDGGQVSPLLRQAVTFGHYDLTADPPLSRMDLILCRNTLMYFNRPAQQGCYAKLYYALNPGGFLFLGSGERPDLTSVLFKPTSPASRIYAKNALAPADARPVRWAWHPRVVKATPDTSERAQISLTATENWRAPIWPLGHSSSCSPRT
jgi:two-component system CheB/CheR fusion protein